MLRAHVVSVRAHTLGGRRVRYPRRAQTALTGHDRVLTADDIMATNVLPAFEASLELGVEEALLERELGWSRAALTQEGALVRGATTYRHMELMYARQGYASFVLEAARRYSLSCLGVVGLACKTAATVADALALHQRYQALTNRTARYSAQVCGRVLALHEERQDTSLGSQLISEYTMFVAVQLLRSASTSAPRVRRVATRRAFIPPDEAQVYEAFLEAPLVCGASAARVECDAALLEAPLKGADAELGRYFEATLARASPAQGTPALIAQAQAVIQHKLPRGEATLEQVAASMGLGARTLQRRLAEHDQTFAILLDATRRSLAAIYLRDPERTLVEVAYLLGYSEQAAFTRAFRRWHQTTPAAWRASPR